MAINDCARCGKPVTKTLQGIRMTDQPMQVLCALCFEDVDRFVHSTHTVEPASYEVHSGVNYAGEVHEVWGL